MYQSTKIKAFHFCTSGQDMVLPTVMGNLLGGVMTAGEVLGRNTMLDFAALHHYLGTLHREEKEEEDLMVEVKSMSKEPIQLKSYRRTGSLVQRQTSSQG